MTNLAVRKVDSGGLQSGDAALVCTLCLTIAGALQELGGYITVVGGLVPSLLIDQESRAEGFHAHAGTRDLDLGIDIGIADDAELAALGARLRLGGFIPRQTAGGGEIAPSWCYQEQPNLRIDLLVPASAKNPHLTRASIGEGLSAAAFSGLEFAFRDRVPVQLSGTTLKGKPASAMIYCCGPASYVVLKVLAFMRRGEDKDAYDLVYLLRFWPAGIQAVAAALTSWRDEELVNTALRNLAGMFADLDSPGSASYSRFRQGRARYDVGEEGAYVYGAEAQSTVMLLLRQL
jgi:hypothetical protein